MLRTSFENGIGVSSDGVTQTGAALTDLLNLPQVYNDSSPVSLTRTANFTSSLGMLSANQMLGKASGQSANLLASGVQMHTFREEADNVLAPGSAILLSSSGSSDTSTQVVFDAVLSELAPGVQGTDLLDVRIASMGKNIFDYAVFHTAGTAAAVGSRMDQQGAAKDGDILLRSNATLVEISESDKLVPLSVGGLSATDPIVITIAATTKFADPNEFKREGMCETNGVVIDFNCNYTTNTHTCDLAQYGGGGHYFWDFTCPYVAPLCMWYDEANSVFSQDGCVVKSGYTPEAVTCECTHLTTFVLGGNQTEPQFSAFNTPAPTLEPSLRPTAVPTHLPTAQPTFQPTHVPTSQPSTLDTVAVAISMSLSATQAHNPAQEAALKTTIATTSGIDEGDIQGFTVTSVANRRRRLGEDPKAGRRQLASYTWSISYSVVSSLGATGYSSASDYAAAMHSSLTSGIVGAIQTNLGVTVSSPVVSAVVLTRSPTPGKHHPPKAPACNPKFDSYEDQVSREWF